MDIDGLSAGEVDIFDVVHTLKVISGQSGYENPDPCDMVAMNVPGGTPCLPPDEMETLNPSVDDLIVILRKAIGWSNCIDWYSCDTLWKAY